MATQTVLGIAHFTFHQGQVAEFKRLTRQCMEIVREQDTGTLRYEVFLTEDETKAVVIEEYVDQAALIDHAGHIGEELSEAITATADVHGEILGELTEEFREQLGGGPVTAFRPAQL